MGVFYKMDDLRKDFEEWLRKQNNSSSTIEQYIRRIDKICRETYQNCNWNNLNGEIFPVFAQYTEYANKEYYLDFVTIRYALNYFKTFSQINNKPSFQKNKKIADIKIFLYHKKSDYFLNTVNFENLYDYLGTLNSILYKQPNQQYKLDYSQRKEFENVIASVLDKNTIKPNRKLAIHIVYKKSVSATRTALSKYYLFQQTTQPANVYATNELFLENIRKKNPNKTVNGHYTIEKQISGKNPLVINAANEQDRLDINFTLTKQDLTQIFKLNKDTVSKLLDKAKFSNNHTSEYDEEDYILARNLVKYYTHQDVIIGFDTEIRTYYNADNINEYLRKHHHHHNNSHIQTINYTKEGYRHWCNRKKALEILGIGKTAFYAHSYKFTYIDYTSYTTKYYIPELKIIKKRLSSKIIF